MNSRALGIAVVVSSVMCSWGSGEPFEVKVKSSVDGKEQPVIVQVPEGYTGEREVPLLVGLHTWSGAYKQQAKAMGPRASKLGWLLILPNFRGANVIGNPNRQAACASLLAQRDVIDAVTYMRGKYAVDGTRIYLMGASGGGHMAMMMAGKYPDVWAGVSAWVGITDLRKWQAETPGYGKHVHACLGGRPGDSAEVDWEYVRRSPVTFIQNAASVWLDLQHGKHDKTVPYRHTVEAFERVSQVPGHRARLTVFDGGHTIKYGDAFEWLAEQRRDPVPPRILRLTTDEAKCYFYVELVPNSEMALATCDVEITEGGEVSLKTDGLKEVVVDLAGAGLARLRCLRIRYASDGTCDAILVRDPRQPAAVKVDGVDAEGWLYDGKKKAARVRVSGVKEACLEVRW